ncbi:hypothetical protein Sros01_68850 [Streptomyces roseochromogenus]|nr:hypothetical protein Sros01_68850 [Streptomyces roseochromogenus]
MLQVPAATGPAAAASTSRRREVSYQAISGTSSRSGRPDTPGIRARFPKSPIGAPNRKAATPHTRIRVRGSPPGASDPTALIR